MRHPPSVTRVKCCDTKGGMATSGELYGAAKLVAVECNAANKAYLLCKKGSRNPADCLAEGAGVKSCVDSLVDRLNTTCGDTYLKYQKCLTDHNARFEECRKQQIAFDKCVDAAKVAA